MPAGVAPEFLAFGEPAAVAFHALIQGGMEPGKTVAVIGGGPIGQLAAQYARQLGAAKVVMTEVAPSRINYAQQIGAADAVLNPVKSDVVSEILAMTEGEGVDLAVECSGGVRTGMLQDTALQAVEVTRAEGTTVVVGTFAGPSEIHMNSIVLMERRIIGSWVWHSADEYRQAMAMIVDGRVQVMPLITRRIGLEDAVEQGIRELHLNRDDHVKILIALS